MDRLAIVFFLEPRVDCSAVAAAFASFLDGVGAANPRLYLDDEGDAHRMPADPTEVLGRHLVGVERPSLFLVEHETGFPRYHGYYLGPAAAEDASGEGDHDHDRVALWFRVPESTVHESGLSDVITFAHRLTDLVPFSFGYVNPALTCEESHLGIRPYIRRYPGLDVVHPSAVAVDIGDRALGPYWLNFFGARLTKRLGGLASIRSDLPGEVDVRRCGHGGTAIMLGRAPDIGDVDHDRHLPVHRHVAGWWSQCLHVPRVLYFEGSREDQRAWHNRFNEPPGLDYPSLWEPGATDSDGSDVPF